MGTLALMKRRVERKVQRFPVRLSLQALNGQQAPDSYLVDISSLGAQVESPMFPGLNTPLEFVVLFPGRDQETSLVGLVKWIKPLIGKPGLYRMGMRFFAPFWELDRLGRQGKL